MSVPESATGADGIDAYFATADAARRLGIQPQTVRAAIRRGRITARRIGRDLFVPIAEVERYRAEYLGRPGRKPRA